MTERSGKKARGPRGTGTIYLNKTTGKFEGQVTVGYDTRGKRRRRKVSGDSRAAVAKGMRAIIAEEETGTAATDRSTTVGELLEDWLTNVAPAKVSPKTLQSYRWAAGHIVPVIGTRRLADLSVRNVEAMLNRAADDGLGQHSCNRLRAVLGQAIQWAERRDMVTRNVARIAELPVDATPPKEGRALTVDEAQELIAATRTRIVKVPRTDRTEERPRRTEAYWLMLLLLGLRPGEAAGLHWDDIDLEEGVVHIRRAMKHDNGTPTEVGEVKTGNRGRGRRTLVMLPLLVDALKRLRTAQVEERLSLGLTWPEKWSGLVFLTEHGTPYYERNLRRDLKQMTAQAGVGHVTRYDLRHSAATLMVAAGARLEDVADALGHEDVRMARSIYTHSTGRPIEAGSDAMGRALFGSQNGA